MTSSVRHPNGADRFRGAEHSRKQEAGGEIRYTVRTKCIRLVSFACCDLTHY